MNDAGDARHVPTVTRRSALRTGGLAALAATVAGLVPSSTAAAAPELPLIDRAEALVLQLEALLIRMNDRDRNNLSQVVDAMGQAAGLREDLFAEGLEAMHGYTGPGRRVMDQIDADEAREAREREAAAAADVFAVWTDDKVA